MPISNYPNGFAQGVAIRGIPLLNMHGGNVFWVDSGAGADTGKGTHNQPFETWDYAVGRCTADNGDIIILKAGHVETVTAAAGLALDVAGITTFFLGAGENQAYVTFTTVVGADMDVDAASITLVNPKFIAGIDALTGPIDVNATDFNILSGEYHDAAGIETTDCVVATAGAARLQIDGWKFFKSDEAGTQKESHIQLNGVDDCILRNIHAEGDFDVAVIENVTDEVLRITMEDHFLKNTDPGNAPCAVLDSACSGWARRLNWRNANGTVVDDVADINWAPDAVGYTTDGYSGDPIGTAATTGVEGKIDTLDTVCDAILADTVAAPWRCVEKSDGAVLTGTDPLFTIAGGPVKARIVGVVTTAIVGATNLRLTEAVTAPSGTVNLNAGAVACDDDAIGTVYTNIDSTSVFTPTTAGASIVDEVAAAEATFILPIGSVGCLGSAARTGVIKWYMVYQALSPDSVVTAAA